MKKLHSILILGLSLITLLTANAQADRWQQRAEYDMKVDLDVNSHQMVGEQSIKYFNNSPDTLERIFYHLYFNAFQPNSEMDMRSRTISDPDGRVLDRIFHLAKDEQGYHKIDELKIDGKNCKFHVQGTILEVMLDEPIMPNSVVMLDMKFSSQVPLQIRRSGRDNAEGISYSMSQWYPKLCEYDYQGWHANPYVGREFHGIWGDFNVTITIDGSFIVAATGVQQTKNEYKSSKKATRTWSFKAENVHDFVWAADPDYTFKSYKTNAGTELQFFYQSNDETKDNWKKLPKVMDEALTFMNKNYGKYPYPVYKFIQGGDGGMEYPMATLITGERSFGSLVGVSIHEWMHSWYQMVLATNEALYPWMDEGFTSFASTETMQHLRVKGLLGRVTPQDNPFKGSYESYIDYAQSGREEALVTHADHFTFNRSYGTSSYTKGQVFMKQLEYVIGEKALRSTLLRYYNEWKFKHPNVNDFIRVAEKVSDIELDWYKEYWVNSTHTIDYAVYLAKQDRNFDQINIFISNEGKMPMPLDVLVSYKDGSSQMLNIALDLMRGNKPDGNPSYAQDWPWTSPVYALDLDTNGKEVVRIEIDPTHRMADTNRFNNVWQNTGNGNF